MQERLLGRLDGELDAELAGQSFQRALEREEVGRLAATAPGLGRQRPDREAADPVRLAVGRAPLARKLTGEDVDNALHVGMHRGFGPSRADR